MKKIILSGVTILIISLTSFIFYKTQSFYMMFGRGEALIRSQNYGQAQGVLLKALVLAPQDIRTLQYIFLTDEKLNSNQGTRQAYDIIEKAGVTNMPFALYVADHFYSEAYYDKAETIYKKLLTFDQRLSIKRKLAEVLLWQKKYEQAIVLLDALVTQDTDNYETKLLLANANYWAQHHEKAIELYRPLLGTNVQTDEMVFNLAEALRFTGQDKEAIQIYDKFLQNK